MRATVSNARMLRTGQPLSLSQIQSVAPAVFAPVAHPDRSERYRYIPTVEPLQSLMDGGWQVWEARQQRSRKDDRDPYMKHMLRLRHGADNGYTRAPDGTAEVVLTNAHDGSASYTLQAGFFRLVCSNGMTAGRIIGSIRVLHTTSALTTEEVLHASQRVLEEKIPAMLGDVERMREYETSEDERMALAVIASKLRYGTNLAPFPAVDLLAVRRSVDAANNMWCVLNRIQENVMDGGWYTNSLLMGRRSMVRPVERVTETSAINMGIWDAAAAIVEA